VAEESAARCHTSALQDINTVLQRFEHEGMSFLTITLPSFGKSFEEALDLGVTSSGLFPGFRFGTRRTAWLPRFLGGFTSQVFDPSSGYLLDEPNYDAILAVRQLTLMFGKIHLPCSDVRVRRAYNSYVECEHEVRMNDDRLSEDDYSDFRRMSNMLFGQSFEAIDQKVFDRELIMPKHGPGSTADKLRGNAKYRQRDWPVRLQEIFPWEEFLAPNSSFVSEMQESVNLVEPEAEMPVSVISVPKTLKTPRIIAMEPTCMMFMQQALNATILDELRKVYHLNRFMDTRHQEPNQLMAMRGSREGSLATLDLSEASDRVSNRLVEAMFVDYPHLLWAVDATRSRKADVPGYGVMPLAKYASMGSGLCFTVEAMVFLTLAFLGIERSLGSRFSPQDLERFVGEVRVYGDDIIVPVHCVSMVIDSLEHFGAKVNAGKSFWTGKFRESCGKEFYNGEDVSIVRVRREFPSSPKDAREVISIIELRNQFYKTGYWSVVKWLDSEIRDVIRHFPDVLPSSPLHGRVTFLGYTVEKMHATLHSPLVKGYMEVSQSPVNTLDDLDALLKFFLERGEYPLFDPKHLERSGRPVAVDIKPRYASPF